MSAHITKSCGNIFLDLGFPPDEAKILTMRAVLMTRLSELIELKGLTQAEAAKMFGVKQSRVSDLVRGKWERFSLDMLVTLALRAGLHVELNLAA
ncbi:MAG: XRE family transcriptional regulator [Magnetococcus sp. YQC-5]